MIRNVLVPGRDGPWSISISNGCISSIRAEAEAAECQEGLLWALPGLIDLQVNDMTWLDSSTSRTTPEQHAARIRHVRDLHLKQGVTGLVLATLAAPLEIVKAYLEGSAMVVNDDSSFYGCLVEGTFMNPDCCGCHNKDYIYSPSLSRLDELISTRGVRMLNVAPEMGNAEDTIDVIRAATREGITVGTGHAKPSARTLRNAVEAGCKYIIHLGNASGSSLKAFGDGGMIEEALRNDDLDIAVIGDCIHVHPSILLDWIARKSLDRVVAYSDQAFAAGLPSSNRFKVFGRDGCLAEDRTYLRVDDLESDVPLLFGSCVTMLKVFENFVNLFTRDVQGIYYRHHAGVALSSAVAKAVQLCSTNPAKLLGKDEVVGSLRPGLEANILLVKITAKTVECKEGNNDKYQVSLSKVFYKGQVV